MMVSFFCSYKILILFSAFAEITIATAMMIKSE